MCFQEKHTYEKPRDEHIWENLQDEHTKVFEKKIEKMKGCDEMNISEKMLINSKMKKWLEERFLRQFRKNRNCVDGFFRDTQLKAIFIAILAPGSP